MDKKNKSLYIGYLNENVTDILESRGVMHCNHIIIQLI